MHEELDELAVDYHGAVVINAPHRALLSVDLIHSLDHRTRVRGSTITFRCGLRYRIVRWSPDDAALIIERIDSTP